MTQHRPDDPRSPSGSPLRERPRLYEDVATCVDDLLERTGRRIRIGIPLGLGKPNQLVNELYRRAVRDPGLEIDLFTALTLEPPEAVNALVARLVEPIRERLYAQWPALEYARDRRRDQLPPNVRVSEFYLSPGQLLDSASAQQSFRSTNYSDAVRDIRSRGLDVVAQLVARRETSAGPRYSFGSNPDLSLDLIPGLRGEPRPGDPEIALAQVNRHMPFMTGDAEVAPGTFDAVVDSAELDFPMFVKPSRPVRTEDWLIGLHASALVRDGGTIQLGIGTMSDAVCHLLRLRHRHEASWREALRGSLGDAYEAAVQIGGDRPFEHGLFANTEMLVEGLMLLYREGVLSRRVVPHAGLQRLLDAGLVRADESGVDLLERLIEHGAVPVRLGESDVAALCAAGVLAAHTVLEDGLLVRRDHPGAAAAATIPADLTTPEARGRVAEELAGPALRGGRDVGSDLIGRLGGQVAHAAFFLGSSHFYRALHELDESQRDQFRMTRVNWTNRLDEDPELARAQRRHARCLNETMMVTALGAAVSDGLEDGRVVSGVGGQYDFVAMAQQLDEGRSILMLPSTRWDGKRLHSNVRYSYGHVTIPRQLRDMVVTEYGVADLRGKSDREVVEAHVRIADARFQDDLVNQAKRAKKLPREYQVPDLWRRNRPEQLEERLRPLTSRDLCPTFPLGSDLTEVEADLGAALRTLRPLQGSGFWRVLRRHELATAALPPAAARPYLERMQLDRPRGLGERLQRAAVLWGLARTGRL